MLTQKEKNILSLLARDLETGRHLIRTEEEWNKVLKSLGEGVTREDYDKLAKELNKAVENFSWYSSEDKSTTSEKNLLIEFKMRQDNEFYYIVNVY